MKKVTFCAMVICLPLLLNPLSSKAIPAATPTSIVVAGPSESAEAKALIQRLNEINAMNKSTLSRSEKKALRNEVRSIDKNLHAQHGGGVYISVGALILILILLIILL